MPLGSGGLAAPGSPVLNDVAGAEIHVHVLRRTDRALLVLDVQGHGLGPDRAAHRIPRLDLDRPLPQA